MSESSHISTSPNDFNLEPLSCKLLGEACIPTFNEFKERSDAEEAARKAHLSKARCSTAKLLVGETLSKRIAELDLEIQSCADPQDKEVFQKLREEYRVMESCNRG